MKKIIFVLGVIFGSKAVANEVTADSSSKCSVSNGWTLSVDYFYDGHPQGPGGWSGIAQLNDWGKFPLVIKNDDGLASTGNSHGADRLDSIDLDFSVLRKSLKMRTLLPLGNYTPWQEHSLDCKKR